MALSSRRGENNFKRSLSKEIFLGKNVIRNFDTFGTKYIILHGEQYNEI